MPQGSDFHQRMMFKEKFERMSLEKQAREIDELRGRVRALEEMVCALARKVGMDPGDQWRHKKICPSPLGQK